MSDLLPASSPVAKLLLDKGFNPSGQDLRKSEALLCAAEYGPADILQLLVDEGAGVDAKEPVFGFTTLQLAAKRGACDIVTILTRANARVAEPNKEGYAAIHVAAGWGQCDAIRLLLTLGAEVSCKGPGERTPLHSAARYGQCDAIQLLLDSQADIACGDDIGQTPIHYACYNGHLKAVQLLVKLGSDINWRSQQGITPLHVAASQARRDILYVYSLSVIQLIRAVNGLNSCWDSVLLIHSYETISRLRLSLFRGC